MVASMRETVDFVLIPSPIIVEVKNVKVNIPNAKPINLPGHNEPLKCNTISSVAFINIIDIGVLNIIAIHNG